MIANPVGDYNMQLEICWQRLETTDYDQKLLIG